jgi:hypothetical protein
MSRLPPGLGFLMVFYCCLLMAFGVCLMLSPVGTFRSLSFGKPLPKLMESRWIIVVYRLTGAVMFFFVVRVLLQSLRP